jgi:hypothetical protein
LFCMFALRHTSNGFPVNKKNYKFGDYALVLRDPNEFMNRIVDKANMRLKANLVEYVNKDYTGEIGLFKKFDSFAYQSEWRIACFEGEGVPTTISIGSIKDISIIMPSKEINERLKPNSLGKFILE